VTAITLGETMSVTIIPAGPGFEVLYIDINDDGYAKEPVVAWPVDHRAMRPTHDDLNFVQSAVDSAPAGQLPATPPQSVQ
jgi:hypothetical protein